MNMGPRTARVLRLMCNLPTEPEDDEHGLKSGLSDLPESVVEMHDRLTKVLRRFDPSKTLSSVDLALCVVLADADELEPADEPDDEADEEPDQAPPAKKKPAGKPKPASKKKGAAKPKPAPPESAPASETDATDDTADE